MNEDELIAPETLLNQPWCIWGQPWANSDDAGTCILAGNEDPHKGICIAGTEDSTGEYYSNSTAASLSQHIVDLHNDWLTLREKLKDTDMAGLERNVVELMARAFKRGFMNGYNEPECLINPEKEADTQASTYVNLRFDE